MSISHITIDDEQVKVERITDIEQDQLARYATVCPDSELSEHKDVVFCCVEREGTKVDYVVKRNGDKGEPVIAECKISYEEISPSEFVEYQFKDDGPWTCATVSLESLEYYRKSKFDIWKEMLMKPTCEAALKRMLQTGIITTLFDDQIFVTPEEDIKDYKVVDEHGKEVRIPHPVHKLRIWDAESQKFKDVSAHLEGAPDQDEQDNAWTDIVDSLKEKHGAEYIDSLMK